MMYIAFLIALELGYLIIFFTSIFTLVHIVRFHKNFGVKFMAILSFLTIFNAVIVYSSLYIYPITFFISETINLLLWKLSILSGFISLILTTLIYTFLKEYKKIPDFPFLLFITLFGLLIGFLFSPNSINIDVNVAETPPYLITDTSRVNFFFNFTTGLIVIIFQSSIAIYYIWLSIIIHNKARNKEITKYLIISTLIFNFPILMYIIYILSHMPIFRELHILSLWITIMGVCVMLIKQPEMFLELTNKIYSINIYHKSGILLYSYKFGKTENEIDSTIWGNILIGINHILSEFVDKKNQIEVLQTNTSDIIVNYDDIGFAVVLITNRKNAILKNLMEKFTINFKRKYENELLEIQDLNKLINVSEFKETKDIVEKSFQLYL